MQAHAFGGPVLCGKSCIANRSYVPVWKRARLSSVAGKALASKCIQLQTITQATLEKEENAHSEAEIDRAVPCNSASSSSTSNDLRNSTQNADSQLKSNAWIDKFALSTAAMLFMSASSAAAAAELAAYDPGSSVDFVKNAAGIGYIGLLAYFCFRLFNKRSKFATSEVSASICISFLLFFIVFPSGIFAAEQLSKAESCRGSGVFLQGLNVLVTPLGLCACRE